jgi:hypothetical protein
MSKMYLIAGLGPVQRARLTGAGIECVDWDANTISVPEGALLEALSLLGARATETATEFKDFFNLNLHFLSEEGRNVSQHVKRVLTPEQEQSRTNYIAACSAQMAAELQAARSGLTASLQEIPEAGRRFVALKRKHLFDQQSLSEAEIAEAFRSELDQLLELPKVKMVRAMPGVIHVHTKTILSTASDTGNVHEIGDFLIVIYTDGSMHGVRWFNGTRRIDGFRQRMNAPNVYADGTACAHELQLTFYELIARCEFAALTDLAIQFVEEVPQEELAVSIRNWPQVS